MPMSPAKPDKPMPQTTERREIKWDAVAAIIASLVGFLALLVAGYTAYVQRYTAQIQMKQVQAQVWPYVELGENMSVGNAAKSDDFAALVAVNKGVGPAIVRRVEILVSGRPVLTRAALFKAIGMNGGDFEVSYSALNGEVLSPGDMNKFVAVLGEKAAAQFHAHTKDVTIRACYASTLGGHWIATTNFHEKHSGARQVPSCALIPKADEFHN